MIKPILSVPLQETKAIRLMKRIISYFRRLRDRRLRKYCVEQAVKSRKESRGDLSQDISWLYYFLTGPHYDE